MSCGIPSPVASSNSSSVKRAKAKSHAELVSERPRGMASHCIATPWIMNPSDILEKHLNTPLLNTPLPCSTPRTQQCSRRHLQDSIGTPHDYEGLQTIVSIPHHANFVN